MRPAMPLVGGVVVVVSSDIAVMVSMFHVMRCKMQENVPAISRHFSPSHMPLLQPEPYVRKTVVMLSMRVSAGGCWGAPFLPAIILSPEAATCR